MRDFAVLLSFGLALAACQPDPPPPVGPAPEAPPGPIAGDSTRLYVPVYSQIYTRDSTRNADLATTLSVRNVDPGAAIEVLSVRYYDSEGRLVRDYLQRPVVLAPLATRSYVVDERGEPGGVGANFLVTWRGEGASEPLVEAVMISTARSQGISFVSRGVPIR